MELFGSGFTITLGDLMEMFDKMNKANISQFEALYNLEASQAIKQAEQAKIIEQYFDKNQTAFETLKGEIKTLNAKQTQSNKIQEEIKTINEKLTQIKNENQYKGKAEKVNKLNHDREELENRLLENETAIEGLNKSIKSQATGDAVLVERIKSLTDTIENNIKEIEKKTKEKEIEDRINPKKSWSKRKEVLHEIMIEHKLNKNATQGFLGLKASLIPFAKILFFSSKVLNKIDDISRKVGVSSQDLFAERESMSYNPESKQNIMSSITNIETMKELQQALGNVDNISLKTLDNISRYPIYLGYSVQESAELLSLFKGINGTSAEVSEQMIRQISILGSKNGIGYKKLLSDIKSNAEYYAKYSGIGYDNLLKANITANKLGIEFSTMAKTLESLNTVESIIEKQMKIAMFTNTQFNLVEAASYQFMGKTDKAMDSLYKNLKLITKEQFDQPYIRGILAQNLGVSVNELVKMYKISKDFNGELAKSARVDMNFAENMGNFTEVFSVVGLSRIKNAFSQYILEPLAEILGSKASGGIKVLIEFVADSIKFAGRILKGIDNVLVNFGDVGSKMLILVGAVGTSIAIYMNSARAISLKTWALLKDIHSAILYGRKAGQASQRTDSTTFLGKAKNQRGKVGGALALTLLPTALSLASGNSFGGAEIGSLIGGIGGAGLGVLMGNPIVGAMIGETLGGMIGTWFSSRDNTNDSFNYNPKIDSIKNNAMGAIVPTGYPNDSYKANLSTGEAVIPLTSKRSEKLIGGFITSSLKSEGLIPSSTIVPKQATLSKASNNETTNERLKNDIKQDIINTIKIDTSFVKDIVDAIKKMNVNLTLNIDNKTDVKSNTLKRAMILSSELVNI